MTEVRRRITTSGGRRYGEDMIIMTQNAASAIALRNAIFRVIPRSLVDVIFEEVKAVATGGKKPIEQKRVEIVAAYGRLGIPFERALAKLGRTTVEDLTLGDIEVLIGYGSRVHQGEEKDDLFPPVGGEPIPGEVGKREPIKRPESKPETKGPAQPETKSESLSPAQRAQEADIDRREQDDQDQDAADRAAAAPTPEELAAMASMKAPTKKSKKDNANDDEETPPWLKK